MRTQAEWANRMKLECLNKTFSPLFLTWTLAPEHYSDSERDIKQKLQHLWMRLRKKDIDVRYFTVVERGSKKGRLHAHSIIWSEKLSILYSLKGKSYVTKFLTDTWTHGIVDIDLLESKKGLSYVTKYIVKDLSDDRTRNYSWSQKPMLGTSGVEYWRLNTYRIYEEEGCTWTGKLSGKMTLPILGQLIDVYIPFDTYMNWSRALGIKRDMIDIESRDYSFNPLEDYNNGEASKSEIYFKELQYLKQKQKMEKPR